MQSVWKRSWPAVSHICTRAMCPSMSSVCILKSIPNRTRIFFKSQTISEQILSHCHTVTLSHRLPIDKLLYKALLKVLVLRPPSEPLCAQVFQRHCNLIFKFNKTILFQHYRFLILYHMQWYVVLRISHYHADG